jgi:hypothetical protein
MGSPWKWRQPRFKLQVDITIDSKACGVLKGQPVDISESGISAMLKIATLPRNICRAAMRKEPTH